MEEELETYRYQQISHTSCIAAKYLKVEGERWEAFGALSVCDNFPQPYWETSERCTTRVVSPSLTLSLITQHRFSLSFIKDIVKIYSVVDENCFIYLNITFLAYFHKCNLPSLVCVAFVLYYVKFWSKILSSFQ